MKIIFVRHGEQNKKTGKLTLRGKIEILQAKRYLKNESFNSVYSSPKVRAIESAKILSKGRNCEFEILSDLDERLPLSSDKEDFLEQYEENYFNYNYENENFETCKQFIDRIFFALNKIKEQTKSLDTILIVAHSSTLYGINAFVNGIPKDKTINWLQCNNGAVVKFFV